jgi:hypothetical protein
MSASIFSDKTQEPDETMLSEALGETKTYLDQICNFIETETGHLLREWKHYGQKSGWLLKLLSKKRNMMFVIPENGCFTVGFVFGDRAVIAVMNSNLNETIKNDLQNARKYAEGRGISLVINDSSQVESVLQLIRIKLEF